MPEKNRLVFKDDFGSEQEDLLQLDNSINNFTGFVENRNFHVLGFTGDWGTGKSTFIQLWEQGLQENQYIHLNAFEKDYLEEPFLAIAGAIQSYLSKNKSILSTDFKEKAKTVFVKTSKALLKGGVQLIIHKTVGDEFAKKVVEEFNNTIFDEVLPDNKPLEDEIQKLRETLTKIKTDRPLFFVIDELDRCRPDYALELLEKVKHIFSVEGIKFILVYNPAVFDAILEKKYGLRDQGRIYLQKFIDIEYHIPQPATITTYISTFTSHYALNNYHDMIRNGTFEIAFAEFILKNKITIRRLKNLLARYCESDGIFKCHSGIREDPALLFLVAFLMSDLNYKSFIKLVNSIKKTGVFVTDLSVNELFEYIVQELVLKISKNLNSEDFKNDFIRFITEVDVSIFLISGE